jgi:sugar phosphate isomerase/epimerase
VRRDGEYTNPKPIRLAGAAWSWVGATLEESAAIYRALGVDALDLIAVPGSRLDTYKIAADPVEQARHIAKLGIGLSNLLMFFGTNFHDRALNSSDPAIRSKNLDTFRRILEFCAAAGFNSVTVLPGVEQPPISRAEALKYAAAELNRMNEVASDAGVLLVYEPHVQSILEDPHDVVTFACENSSVKLVIDYSHAVSLGFSRNDLDPLVQHAGHVHLRQAAPDKIQARWDEGTIDFPALIDMLKSTAYQGYLTLEYEHDKFWNMDRCDVMTETIKMRDVVLPCLC